MEKRIILDTDQGKGKTFKVTESGGKFYVYRHVARAFSFGYDKFGETRSLEDAITLIKTSVSGKITNTKIEDM